MRRKASSHTKIRIAGVFGILALTLGGLLWTTVLGNHVIVPAQAGMVGGNFVADYSSSAVYREPENIGVPMRIQIPSIAVDAAIERVKLTRAGSMDVPKSPRNTAWYALGPRPGEGGSAVLAGHVDWWNGSSAVFKNLHKVKPGEIIKVEDENGEMISFVVREIRKYDAGADAREVFGSNDGKSHLNIITCYGTWDKKTQRYTKRLVVFTERVESIPVQISTFVP